MSNGRRKQPTPSGEQIQVVADQTEDGAYELVVHRSGEIASVSSERPAVAPAKPRVQTPPADLTPVQPRRAPVIAIVSGVVVVAAVAVVGLSVARTDAVPELPEAPAPSEGFQGYILEPAIPPIQTVRFITDTDAGASADAGTPDATLTVEASTLRENIGGLVPAPEMTGRPPVVDEVAEDRDIAPVPRTLDHVTVSRMRSVPAVDDNSEDDLTDEERRRLGDEAEGIHDGFGGDGFIDEEFLDEDGEIIDEDGEFIDDDEEFLDDDEELLEDEEYDDELDDD